MRIVKRGSFQCGCRRGQFCFLALCERHKSGVGIPCNLPKLDQIRKPNMLMTERQAGREHSQITQIPHTNGPQRRKKREKFQQSGSFIYDVYSGTLGRQPAYVEYAADRQQVIGGANLDEEKNTFTRAFVQRPEFVQKYQSATTAELFVDALIRNVQLISGVDLNGERDALIARYATGLAQIEARAFVVRHVADNAAFRQVQYNPAFVLTEYFGYLRRDPNQGGYAFWLDVLNNGATDNYRGMVCVFVTSAEYQARFATVTTHTNGECSGP
jgi:uncharacterized protein DUF4214